MTHRAPLAAVWLLPLSLINVGPISTSALHDQRRPLVAQAFRPANARPLVAQAFRPADGRQAALKGCATSGAETKGCATSDSETRSKTAPAADTAADCVARIMRADYEGDRAALHRLATELAALSDPRTSRIEYWRGYALLRAG